MDKLKNNIYALSIGAGIVGSILFYIEQIFIKKKETIDTMNCIKIFVLIVGLVMGCFTIYNSPTLVNKIETEVPKLVEVEQSIHMGEPNF